MRWRDDQIDTLKAMHASGYSMRQIAAALYERFRQFFSRNAVIGKCHRLELPPRETKQQEQRPKRRRRRGKKLPDEAKFVCYDVAPKSVTKPAPMKLTSDADIPLEQRVQIWDLTNETCRWPIDVPHGLPSYQFCGHPSADLRSGRAYCEHHARIAFKPQPRPRMQAAE